MVDQRQRNNELMESELMESAPLRAAAHGRTPTDPARAAPAVAPGPNLYAIVHKALRACLADTLLASGRTDPDDDGEVAHLSTRVRLLCTLYRLHSAKEDQFIHPAMEARRPGSSRRTADDHVQHARALDRLDADVRELEAAAGSARSDATQTLYRDLALFAADDLVHMHAE